MIKFKQLRENFLPEAYSRKFNDNDVDKEFKNMKDPESFYGDLDKARAEMKKDYHPGNSARPKVWTALRYPVRDGDYYFAFIDKNERKNMKYNEQLNDALKKAKVGGDKKSVDDMWLIASNELRTYPKSLGWNDTMTREEIYGAIQHLLGKIREEVVQKEFFGMFNRKDPHKGLRVGKRRKAPRFESVKESVQEAKSYPDRLVQKAVKIAMDMGGNMTGAYKKIEKMAKGLGDDKVVANALRLANESVNEGFMKNLSQRQIKRKYGRVIKKTLAKGSLEFPSDVEEALFGWAFDHGEIKTDDPDEFIDWLDRNAEDFSA